MEILRTPDEGSPPGGAFQTWKKVSQEVPAWAPIIAGACVRGLSDAEAEAYDAPFPEEPHRAASRQFPLLVPASPDDPAIPDNRRAWRSLERFEKPFLLSFSDKDPMTAPMRHQFERVPGAKGQPHTTIRDAGHFLQEDAGPEFAAVVNEFIAHTR